MLPAQTAIYVGFTDGELKQLYPHMLSSKPPDSVEKNSDFTGQNPGVAGLPPPPSFSLYVFLCDFGVLTY